ncbi:MAG: lipoprotein [Frankiales bacterium]|jgi:hypothetical protein|nr:lipoprotein [Frankiales bacterium]
MRRLLVAAVLVPSTALALAACGGSSGGTTGTPSIAPPSAPAGSTVPSPASTGAAQQGAIPVEKNPPGDIPDNLAFVAYNNTTGKYTFTHPEGWAETTRGSTVTFTDKLNGVQVLTGSRTTPATVGSAKQQDVPALSGSQAAFELRGVTSVKVPAGTGVRIVYRRNSAPDPVTGRQYRDEVERYEIVGGGREVVMELFGPVGSDNVDAYRTMIQSLRLS